jgi:GDP-4-dehydro-6-deoxy-D-mannose reductase
MTRTILISGVNGWTGRYLTQRVLRDDEARVVGIGLQPELSPVLRPWTDRIRYHQCNLTSTVDVIARVLQSESIDEVIHLAGITGSVDWDALLRINVGGTANLLGALALHRQIQGKDPTILIVSSSAAYGAAPMEGRPVAEDCLLRPVSPYGVSKAAQELTALQFYFTERMKIVVVRPFNLVGPGQPVHFVCSSLACQIATAEKRQEPAIVQMGRLDSERDFIDIRDAVDLYVRILEKGTPGRAYNCGSGVVHSIEQALCLLKELAFVEVRIQQKDDRFRSGDVRSLWADLTTVTMATGWKPLVSLETSLHDLLESWRRQEV